MRLPNSVSGLVNAYRHMGRDLGATQARAFDFTVIASSPSLSTPIAYMDSGLKEIFLLL
jgi:hypothetical protein